MTYHLLKKLALAFLILVPAVLPAKQTPIVDYNINVHEAEKAQKAWGDALVRISKDYEAGGIAKATRTAEAMLDSAYGYDIGPVLFKPTLTVSPQTFRTTKEGALSYFVGNNSHFPNDAGFALKGWRSCKIENAGIYINGNIAITMGKVRLTDKKGKVTEVDKTWVFRKDDKGKLKIILHHSSLPVNP
jgi:hypothetical protein